MTNRLLVCGDRNWINHRLPDGRPDDVLNYAIKDASFRVLTEFAKANDVSVCIEGCARGADRVAEDWSERYPLLIREHLHFPADWDKYRPASGIGNPAGPIRNEQMLKEGRPDFVIAFHDHLETSKGTGHMVRIAKKAGVPVLHFTSEDIEPLYPRNST